MSSTKGCEGAPSYNNNNNEEGKKERASGTRQVAISICCLWLTECFLMLALPNTFRQTTVTSPKQTIIIIRDGKKEVKRLSHGRLLLVYLLPARRRRRLCWPRHAS